MTGRTDYLGLSTIEDSGDSVSEDNYKYGNADRRRIDAAIRHAHQHHHRGAAAVQDNPSVAPSLATYNTGGTLPAGLRIYYAFTLVDANGAESALSPEAFIDTPDPVAEPAGAALSVFTTGGTLLPGNYGYAISAYKDANTLETKAPTRATITVPSGTTNRIRLALPSLPAGASGFNVYRKGPGGDRYYYLDSIAGAAPEYIDTGAVGEDCDRGLPLVNNTNGTNRVEITYPGTTPAVPVGFTWKIYRTFVLSQWDGTLLHHVIEETAQGSGIIAITFTDTGQAGTNDSPPEASEFVEDPDQINLATDVTGRLPAQNVDAFPQILTFHLAGEVTVTPGAVQLVLQHLDAMLIHRVWLSLNDGSTPTGTDVVADVLVKPSGGAYASVFAAAADRPKVVVGQGIGAAVAPTAASPVFVRAGGAVRVDVTQAGSSTAVGLTIHILAYFKVDAMPAVAWPA